MFKSLDPVAYRGGKNILINMTRLCALNLTLIGKMTFRPESYFSHNTT